MNNKQSIILWFCSVLTTILLVWCIVLQVIVVRQAETIEDHVGSFNFIMEYNGKQTDEIIELKLNVGRLFENDKILERRIDVLYDIY
jgi:hypothetical protein